MQVEVRVHHIEPLLHQDQLFHRPGMDLDAAGAVDEDHNRHLVFCRRFQHFNHRFVGHLLGKAFRRQAQGLCPLQLVLFQQGEEVMRVL